MGASQISSVRDVTRGDSLFRFYFRRFLQNRMALLGAAVLTVILLLIIFAPLFTQYMPTDQDLRNRLKPPSTEHWMGTDDLGRDMWTRVLYGGRISLTVGLLAMVVSIMVGSLVGLASGYYRGWVDILLSRITEIFMTVPRLFILIVLSMILRKLDLPWFRAGSFTPIALVIGLLSWMSIARLVRASTLEMREREFILATRALGGSDSLVMFKHIFPNVLSPVIVAATLGLAGAIISESGLSYLGLGVQLPTPTWGNMLGNTQSLMTIAPWTALFPGLMIFLVVIAINYLGDGLRDALDPRHSVTK